MTVKRLVTTGLLVLAIAMVAVFLFFAGDHDEEYRSSPAKSERSR